MEVPAEAASTSREVPKIDGFNWVLFPLMGVLHEYVASGQINTLQQRTCADDVVEMPVSKGTLNRVPQQRRNAAILKPTPPATVSAST